MRWASAISELAVTEDALDEAAEEIRAQLDGATPDLCVAFASPAHRDRYERLPALIAEALPGAFVFGCTGGGIVGGGREVEHQAALSLTVGSLPGVHLRPYHFDRGEAPEPGVEADPHAFLLLADPFSSDVRALTAALDAGFPEAVTVGGLASGSRGPGETALFLGDTVHRTGAVALALSGDIRVDTVVAQGCRPIGQPLFITRCAGHTIYELDGEPVVQVLERVLSQLPPEDQQLARHSLFLGVVMREAQEVYEHGDFLIRNLVGLDPQRGGLAVAAHLRQGQVVQLHLRDAQTSAQDLAGLLVRHSASAPPPLGALMFSCLGRGQHLYGEPDHDTRAFAEHLGPVPLGGFFCNGEIGPVQGRTFLHGYTSSFALFRPA